MSIDRAADLLTEANHILVFTGAGVSTESGIPDFRGPNGVWTKVDPNEFTYERYLTIPDTRIKSWQRWSTSPLRAAQPNATHQAIVSIASSGRLEGCVTQNIDGLHQAAGLSDELTVEVHGNVRQARCLSCDTGWSGEEIFERVVAGDADPHCERCGGIIKLTVISFGQQMPYHEMSRGYAMAQAADAVLAVGTTLSVWPAADIPLAAARRGIPFIIVNRGDTDLDEAADVKIDGSAGEVMSELVKRIL